MTIGLVGLAILGAAAAILIAAAVRTLSRRVERRLIITTLIGIGFGGAAWVYFTYGLIAAAAVLLLVSSAGARWVVWRRGGTARTVTLWGERARRRSGVATPLHIARVASGWAMHRKARAARPHLRQAGWLQRWRVPTRELGVLVARSAGMRVWAAVEDVVLVFAGPRTGKTLWLGWAVVDAPGAVVTTSTRLDLYRLTHKLRARRGRPVFIFNPGGLGGLASTITFDPLQGCDDPETAIFRAADMLPVREDGNAEREFWDGLARHALAGMLHAAGLSKGTRTMRDIQRWVADPDKGAPQIYKLLKWSREPSFIPAIEQFVTNNDTTRSSITTGMTRALEWLTSADAVAATQGGEPFDVAELLRTRGTVYMLGRHDAHTAPLLAALTGYIAREARKLAADESFAHQCDERLDPPLTIALDEAARVSPVPLPDWTGDFGGSGVQLLCVFQSRADVIERWGATGAAKILNNSGTVMYLGGNKDAAGNGDLEFWSKLAGPRDEPVKTRNGDGKVVSTTVRVTQVLSVAQLQQLPRGRVVIYANGMPPVVGRAVRVWDHPEYRALLGEERRRPVAQDTRAPVHVVAHPAIPPAAPAHPGVLASPSRELSDAAH